MKKRIFLSVLAISILSVSNKIQIENREVKFKEGWATDQYIFDDQKDFEWGLGSDYELGSEYEPSKNTKEINYYSKKKACAIDSFEIDEKF